MQINILKLIFWKYNERKSWAKCFMVFLMLMISENYIGQSIDFESDCLVSDFIPITGVDGTGRNIFSDGSVEIRYFGLTGWWNVYINGSLAFYTISASTPNPPTSSTWVSNGYMSCTTMIQLVINGVIEICNNGEDEDGDLLIDCLDDDCNGDAACNDNDLDGTNDWLDKDDDNDGISDLEESNGEIHHGHCGWSHNNPSGGVGMDYVVVPEITQWMIQSFSDQVVNNITASTPGTLTELTDIDGGDLADAILNEEYVYHSFTTSDSLMNPVLHRIRLGLYTNANSDSYYASAFLSDDGFLTQRQLSNDVFITSSPTSYEVFEFNTIGDIPLKENTLYEIKIFVYGVIDDASASRSIWDDLYLYFSADRAMDFDSDGVLDHNDLDSDNDGIPDEIENPIANFGTMMDWYNGGSPYFLNGSPTVNETQTHNTFKGLNVTHSVDLSQAGMATNIEWESDITDGVSSLLMAANFSNEIESWVSILSFELDISNFYCQIIDVDNKEGVNVIGFLNGAKVTPIMSPGAPEMILVNESDSSITAYSNTNTDLDPSDLRSHVEVFFNEQVNEVRVKRITRPTFTGDPGNGTVVITNIIGFLDIDLDADGDSRYNRHDLDSDNDGIHDVLEAGYSLYDGNADGKVDGAVGINGLLNALETSSDSGILLTAPNDSDGDWILNHIDLDSDNDNCSDTKEAGYPDSNNDGELGGIPISIDLFGRVLFTP